MRGYGSLAGTQFQLINQTGCLILLLFELQLILKVSEIKSLCQILLVNRELVFHLLNKADREKLAQSLLCFQWNRMHLDVLIGMSGVRNLLVTTKALLPFCGKRPKFDSSHKNKFYLLEWYLDQFL